MYWPPFRNGLRKGPKWKSREAFFNQSKCIGLSVRLAAAGVELGRTTDSQVRRRRRTYSAADYLYNPSKCHKMKVQDDISFKAAMPCFSLSLSRSWGKVCWWCHAKRWHLHLYNKSTQSLYLFLCYSSSIMYCLSTYIARATRTLRVSL